MRGGWRSRRERWAVVGVEGVEGLFVMAGLLGRGRLVSAADVRWWVEVEERGCVMVACLEWVSC
jgi:hypothetical protein